MPQVSLAAGMAKGLTPMKRDMAIFITSNPSYMGRGELPVNLKSLFRPVAMMAPDFTVVAEVFLVAAGFERAKEAAEQVKASPMTSLPQLNRTHNNSHEALSQSSRGAIGVDGMRKFGLTPRAPRRSWGAWQSQGRS